MIRLFTLILFAALPLLAQTQKNYAFNLDNGALVLYQIYSEVSLGDGEQTFGKAEVFGNVVRRTLVDERGMPWFGFEVRIERRPGPLPFHISVEPLSGTTSFAKRPAPRDIHEGDRIILDVLEEPSTGRKVFDTFQVGTKTTPMQILPLSHSVPQVPAAGSILHLDSPRVVNGPQTLGESKLTVAAASTGIALPGVGRFIFASQPLPGFRMEAIADDKSIGFVVGSERYQVLCGAPIVDRPGPWYLWVRYEPAPNAESDSIPAQGGTLALELFVR